jgi:hypothetical protein
VKINTIFGGIGSDSMGEVHPKILPISKKNINLDNLISHNFLRISKIKTLCKPKKNASCNVEILHIQ